MTTRNLAFSWTAALLVALTTATAQSQEPAPHADVPLSQVREEVAAKKAVLFAVREPEEWEQGHVKGAFLLSQSRLKAWEKDGMTEADKAEVAKALPKGAVIYTHCGAGRRAAACGVILRKLGYETKALKPGYEALVEAGFPNAEGK